MYNLVDLPLHEILLGRRVASSAHREEPRPVSVEDQAALHADDARVCPTIGRRVVVQRADQVVTCPALARGPMIADEDA